MISLYPSHIHISFPYPYISHIYKSFIIFAGCPATCFFIFHFSFFLWRGAGCVFLVVFWCRYCGWFSVCLSSRSSFRSSLSSVFRPVPRFSPRPVLPVSPFSPSFAPPFRFVCSFGRVVEAVRAAVFGAGRLACRLAWRDVGAFVVCAVFVSSCSWALAVVSGFPFSPFGVSSVLLVSAGREVRCLSCECRSGRMRLRCGVVSFSRPVLASRLCLFDWRPVPSRLLLVVAVVPFRVRLVGCVVWRRV